MDFEDYILDRDEFIARIKSGGLGAVENHIVVGDSADILQHLPSGCIDLVHTSPPYNIDKQYRSELTDFSPQGSYTDFLKEVIGEVKRTLKPNGSVFWQTGYTQNQAGLSGDLLPIDILTYDFFHSEPNLSILWDRVIWRYFGGMAFKKKLTNKHETILWYVKPDGRLAEPHFDVDQIREKSKELDKRNNFWGRNPGNVWEVDRVAFGMWEQSSHIAVFPEEISEKLVRACSRPDSLILDPFSGSGTLPKVARSLGRRWLGIEISKEYALEAARRLGYQQPSEVRSLASYLIKYEVFRGTGQSLTVDYIAENLQRRIRHVDTELLRHNFDELVNMARSDNTRARSMKRKAWAELDERINNWHPSDPAVVSDRYLCRDYKNRRNLNGPSRYQTGLATLESLNDLVTQSGVGIKELVLQIVEEEPSSYKIVDDTVTLLTTEKRLKQVSQTIESNASDSDKSSDKSKEEGSENELQPKLLL
jgi:adenine-specific DNA-methyltransferase